MESSPDQVPEQVEDKSETSQDQVRTKSRKSPSSDGKITKIKSPGRVAAGKKLAEMNKKNKEKKTKPASEQSEEGWNIYWGYVIGAAGVTIATGSLYYNYKEHQRTTAPVSERMTNPLSASSPRSGGVPVTAPAPPSKKRLIEME